MRHLRDFGFGRRFDELELEIDEELREFVDIVKNGPKYEYEKVRFGAVYVINVTSNVSMLYRIL